MSGSSDTTVDDGDDGWIEATINTLRTRIENLEEKVERQAERIDELETENSQLRRELKSLHERTDLLEHVEDVAALKPEKRAAILLQTLQNKARTNDGRAYLTAQQAVSALGGGVDRTLVYRDFETAEDLVGDSDIVWYQKESRGSTPPSRLIIDLNEGELPSTVAGQRLTGDRRTGDRR